MSNDHYTRPAIALHWLMALIILLAFPVGLYMTDLPLSPDKLRIYSYHKWAGVTVFLLAVLRVLWRATHPAPAMTAAMPAWQRGAAHGIHHLLYLLIFAVPISGWLMSSALGFQTVYFGVLPLPDVLEKDKALGEALKVVHLTLNWLMATLIVVHAVAAVKHHFADRDDTLIRMLPILGRKS